MASKLQVIPGFLTPEHARQILQLGIFLVVRSKQFGFPGRFANVFVDLQFLHRSLHLLQNDQASTEWRMTRNCPVLVNQNNAVILICMFVGLHLLLSL